MKFERMSFWRELWWKERGILARILCFVTLHAWRANCSGWTGEEFESCGRCLAVKKVEK